ncbi:unnamed protein product [Caenorhabditis angaria]|uniref:Uncharacterized protein n=1 Tax=Caenorhabditis angaria TaxID=860376 RepID=A0A9P1MWC5_9PELO|nr:unnamed protein product [Caenorhabditis angaria]
MTYDLSRLTQDIPPTSVVGVKDGVEFESASSSADQNGNAMSNYFDDLSARRRFKNSRCSSYDSISGEILISDFLASDELDKLSSALSEVSSSNENVGSSSTSLFYDLFQAQLALWTCAFSLLYSYAWMQHRKKFLISIFVVVPVTFSMTCVMSWLLGLIVIVGRMFSTPVDYQQYLDLSRHGGLDFGDRGFIREAFRNRSYSGASSISCQGIEDYSGQTSSSLPKPLCRRHSNSYTSLCQSRPPSVNRKLSYCYSHKGEE